MHPHVRIMMNHTPENILNLLTSFKTVIFCYTFSFLENVSMEHGVISQNKKSLTLTASDQILS